MRHHPTRSGDAALGVRHLALEAAPVRVNLIAAGFVDTPLSPSPLGDEIGEHREQLRAPRCRSAASPVPPTSPPWPSTS